VDFISPYIKQKIAFYGYDSEQPINGDNNEVK